MVLDTPSVLSVICAPSVDDAAEFADNTCTEHDRETDMIYEQVDLRIQSFRQLQRDPVLQQQLKKLRGAKLNFTPTAADLKGDLLRLSLDEWAVISSISDYSIRNHPDVLPAILFFMRASATRSCTCGGEGVSHVGSTPDLP